MKIRPATSFNAHLTPPGDKSITHRAFLLASLAKGISTVENASTGEDCASTRRCLETLGARFEDAALAIRIFGGEGRSQERVSLDCGNSGTTMRLLMGILASAPRDTARTEATLWGDASLHRRPMERVARPLRQMGAQIETSSGVPPVRVLGSRLRGASLTPEAASAQIKSAIEYHI